MKTKNFLASCAKATFALATVVMMSAVLTSCSKDNDDNNGELPEAKPNTVVIDSKEKPILSAKYEARSENDYGFWLYLDAAHNEYVYFSLNGDVHLTGKPFELTKREPKHKGYAWWIVYRMPNGKDLFEKTGTYGKTENTLFNTGTLTMSGKPDGTISIKVANGRVVGNDNQEHTLTVRYVGTAEKN